MSNSPSISGRYPLKQAVIDESTLASNEIVAAVAGKSIRPISFFFTVGGAVNIEWKSATTKISGTMEFADSGGISAASPEGLMWTAVGEGLFLDQDAAVSVGGTLTYIEV